MKVQSSTKEIDKYSKTINFTYLDQEYTVWLSWEDYEGYTLAFFDKGGKEIRTPEWAYEWEVDNPLGDGESLAFTLDELSDKKTGE